MRGSVRLRCVPPPCSLRNNARRPSVLKPQPVPPLEQPLAATSAALILQRAPTAWNCSSPSRAAWCVWRRCVCRVLLRVLRDAAYDVPGRIRYRWRRRRSLSSWCKTSRRARRNSPRRREGGGGAAPRRRYFVCRSNDSGGGVVHEHTAGGAGMRHWWRAACTTSLRRTRSASVAAQPRDVGACSPSPCWWRADDGGVDSRRRLLPPQRGIDTHQSC